VPCEATIHSMDETGAWITLTLLCILAVVFGIWWKFIRGKQRAGANRSTGSSESGGLDGEDSTIAVNARRGARTARSIKYLGWMLTTVALLGALGLGLRTWMRYEILHPWPRTTARILSTEIYSTSYWSNGGRSTSAGWRISYGFHCTLQYSVNGQQYESLADLGVRTQFHSSLEQWPPRLPSGTDVVVAYNPADPAEVVLAGTYRMAYAPAFTGFWPSAWCLLVGVSLMIASRKLRSSSEELPSMSNNPTHAS
jgi:Protein of unknown function (DUF3592)